MLFFRSEEHVRRWCEMRGISAGATLSVAQGWRLATAWYAGRADAGWRRRSAEEAQAILDGVGLNGPFWRLA